MGDDKDLTKYTYNMAWSEADVQRLHTQQKEQGMETNSRETHNVRQFSAPMPQTNYAPDKKNLPSPRLR